MPRKLGTLAKDLGSVAIETEDHRRRDLDSMSVEFPDLVAHLVGRYEIFTRMIEGFTRRRLHAHEQTLTATLGRRAQQFLVVGHLDRGLTRPLDFQRLESVEQVQGIPPIRCKIVGMQFHPRPLG